MKFHRKVIHALFSLYFVFTLIWHAFLYTLSEHTTLWNYTYNIIYGSIFLIGGVITVFYATRFSLKTNIGKMLFFFGLGLLSFWVGNMIWAYYTFFLKTEIPFPSFADLAYSTMYPLIAIGMMYLLWIYKTLITKSLVRDSILIVIASFIVVFGFFAKPDISEGLSFIQKFINVYYIVGDVIVLSIGLIAIRIGGGKLHPSIYILSLGFIVFTAADLLFAYENVIGTYWNGDLADGLYSISGYVIATGLFEMINSLNTFSTVDTRPGETDRKS